MRASSRRNGGFTLLELLIALSILALVATAGVAGLKLGAFGLNRADVHEAELEDLRLLATFVRERLADAQPLIADRERATIAFEGERARVRFAAVLPPGLDRPGVRAFELAAERRGGGVDLVLGEAPWGARDALARRVLVAGLAGLQIDYFGQKAPDRDRRWHTDWREQPALPSLVRIAFERRAGQRPWPPLIVQPALDREVR
ncbi:MAG: prepilin-type N-terminal cleavage/methylation domain-containing protein [Alphaproteobacteria bacterium]|nr:prepilin-type N-terminal cleavage/methylation domain-containing protein [Alphaproteobacteria bacterium]